MINTPIVSTTSNPCSQLSIQSNGASKYVLGGWYEKYIFGIYSFASTDTRGNNIYHANIKGKDWFLVKDMENSWVVRTTSLQSFKIFVKLNAVRRLYLTSTGYERFLLFMFYMHACS